MEKLVYNAQSPDEAALVTAAKNFGFVFKSRSPFAITVHNLSSDKEVCTVYKGLSVLHVALEAQIIAPTL